MTAFQSGNGLVNLVTPTSAVVMGGLAIARVGYGTWIRFVWPLLHHARDTVHGGHVGRRADQVMASTMIRGGCR